MEESRNVTSDKGVSNISKKEITIPLAEYTELIEKKAVLEQVKHAVAKDNSEFGAVAILKAILRIDTPNKE
ncbi:MAG: hypothetical protein J5979_03735 [Lachnospiraceae bacterium]|nr:hypothetical protein [Lachnospiraceae bacterium]